MPAPSDNTHTTDKLWTISNIITLLRICLVPVFVVALLSPWPEWFGYTGVSLQLRSFVAALIFILISCTDWLDGYLARSRDEVTTFGKFMDPLADKILVAAALLCLVELGVLPSWPVIIILAREFIVSGIRMIAADKNVVIAASWYGKAKTVTQIIAIVLFIVKDSLCPVDPSRALENPLYVISWVVMIAALILTIISMLDYFVKARNLLGFADEGTEKPEQTALSDKSASTYEGIEDINLEQSAEKLSELATSVIEEARAKHVTIATAESLTGGLTCSALTSVPGSSAVVRGSIVSYVNDIKREMLGVNQSSLDSVGAVSEQVAKQMALGVHKRLSCNIAVSMTGIAGPTGAEPGKPVGTVWIGLAFDDSTVQAHRFHFNGNREEVRIQSACAALTLILEYLHSI